MTLSVADPPPAPLPFYFHCHRRLAAAFECLEEQVRAGTVKGYGLASDSFCIRAPDGSVQGHLSLSKCLDLARDAAGGAHHLRAVQIPLNINESRCVARSP